MNERTLERDGFCRLKQAVSEETVERLLAVFRDTFEGDSDSVRARSSRGHVYAARNLIDSIPEVTTVWQWDSLVSFFREQRGDQFGLVRALFFDKPPDRTWALAWRKATSIAVKDSSIASAFFSRPTVKAGVPHVIACGTALKQMLTLRIHLDEFTDENGPLRVIPGSHVSSTSEGDGLDATVDIHAQAGDVLAMRPLISHSSGASKAGTRRHRRILHLEFAASANLPDAMQWHDFVTRANSPTELAISDTRLEQNELNHAHSA